MKNITFTIAAFLLFTSAAFAGGITVQELHDRLADGEDILLVNVSDEAARADVKFDLGGKLIEPSAFLSGDSGLEDHMGDEIVVYDRSGRQSGTTVLVMNTRGFTNARSLTGGLLAWIEAYGRTMPKRSPTTVVADPPSKPAIGAAATPTPAVKPALPTQPATPAKDLSVDEIIAKHVDAIGGRAVIGRIQSIYMETIVEIMGNESNSFVTILNGKGYRFETDLMGNKMIQCFNDRAGWAVNPMAGGKVEEMPAELYKGGRGEMDVGGALFDYAAKGSKAELLGKEGDLYKIKLTTRDAQVSTYYIDSSTYLVNKVSRSGEMMGQSVEIIASYRDYKKTDFGFVIPYTSEKELGSLAYVTRVTKIEINKPVDQKIFEMPK